METQEINDLKIAVETLSTQVSMALAEQKRTNNRVDKLIDLLFGEIRARDTEIKTNDKEVEIRLVGFEKKSAWLSGFCAINSLAILANIAMLARFWGR